MSVATENAQRLADLIREAGSVVALTGAGISVPSGIPDFRSPGVGLWENVDPMEVAHIDAFHRDPERFWSFYSQRFQILGDKQPNPAHAALAQLEDAGLLDAVITQNIDRLHHKAGTHQVIEVHGSIDSSSCLSCGARQPLEDVRRREARDAAGVPRCDCGRPLKPDVVLFGELLPAAAIARAQKLSANADLMLCIGSSLEVYPVAGLPEVTLRAGGQLAIITQGATPSDNVAAVRMSGDVVDELQALLGALGLSPHSRHHGPGGVVARDPAHAPAPAGAGAAQPDVGMVVSTPHDPPPARTRRTATTGLGERCARRAWPARAPDRRGVSASRQGSPSRSGSRHSWSGSASTELTERRVAATASSLGARAGRSTNSRAGMCSPNRVSVCAPAWRSSGERMLGSVSEWQ